jgi:hypothetical protein
MNASEDLFRTKMNKVNLFMRNRKLPEDIQARIRNYYRTFWSRQGGIDDGGEVLHELPSNLKTEVALFMNKDIVQKIPVFICFR